MTRPPITEGRRRKTSRRLLYVVVLAVVLPTLLLALNGACSEQPVSRAEPLQRDDPSIPGLSSPRTGTVAAIDAVWSDDDVVHVVWTEGRNDGFGGDSRLYYTRASDSGSRWSPPTELASEWSQEPFARIFQAEDGLHIFFSCRIRHLVSSDGGRSWTERQSHLPKNISRIENVAVIALERAFCVAFVNSVAPSAESSPGRRLTIARVSLDGVLETSRDHALATNGYSGSMQFVAFRQNVFLFGSNLGFAYAASEDGGRTWGDTRVAKVPWNSGSVQISNRGDGLVAVWGETQIGVAHSTDGLTWTAPATAAGGERSMSARLLLADASTNDCGVVIWKQHITPSGMYGPVPDEKTEHLYAAPMCDMLAATERGERPVWQGFLPASASASGFATVSNGKQRLVFWHDGPRQEGTSGIGRAKRIYFTPFPIADDSELSRLRAATVEGSAPTVALREAFVGRIKNLTVQAVTRRFYGSAETEFLAGPSPEELNYQIVFFVPGSPHQRWATTPMRVPAGIQGTHWAPLVYHEPNGTLPPEIADEHLPRLHAAMTVSASRKPLDVTKIPESVLVRGAVRVAIDRKPLPPPRTGPDGPRP